MIKKLVLQFVFAMGLVSLLGTSAAHADYLQFSGPLSMLRVHDVGSGYGSGNDTLDAEVVIAFKNSPGKSFGFKLRNDSNGPAHEAMVNLLRDAFANGYNVVINAEIAPGENNGVLNRVWVTR